MTAGKRRAAEREWGRIQVPAPAPPPKRPKPDRRCWILRRLFPR